jgi:ribosomal protein L37E
MKRKKPVFSETIACQRCGKETQKNGAMQKYCPECSGIKDTERKAKWAKDNPLQRTAEQNKANHEKQLSMNVKRGLINNKSTVENIAHFPEVDLQWLVKIAVPFSRMKRIRKGKKILTRKNRQGKEERKSK